MQTNLLRVHRVGVKWVQPMDGLAFFGTDFLCVLVKGKKGGKWNKVEN